MQSIRRAALRSALAASRTVTSTARSSPFASQVAGKIVSPVVKQSSIMSARFFSQTGRVASEEKPVEESETKPAEEAVEANKAAEEFEPDTRTPYGVFIRNIVYDATPEHLKALFEQYGKVNFSKIALDGGQMSKGFGFVYFTNEYDREQAIRALDQSFWHGRRIFVSKQQSTERKERPSNPPSRSLYIGNLPYETTDQQLNDLFSGLNGVVDVRVAVDRTTGWPRGFCHVDFKDLETASAAMEQLKEKPFGNRVLKLDWAVSRDRPLRNRLDRSRGDSKPEQESDSN